jgi:protein O-GlcNAc transferase
VADLQYALRLARAGDIGRASEECLRVLAAAPDDIPALNLLAELYLSGKNPAGADECLERITRITPTDAAAHRRLGNARFNAGAIEKAIRSFRTAIELEPGSVAAHNNLGRTLLAAGDTAGARASYERALGLEPNYAIGHVNLAVLLVALGELAQALVHFERALAIRPELAEGWTRYATLLLRLNRPAEGLACCDRALALNPRMPEALYARAACLHELKRFSEALAGCDQALAERPAYAEAHYSRAKILRDQGDWRGAVAGFDAALRADPDYEAARWARAVATIPALPESEAEIEQSRAAFAAAWSEVRAWHSSHALDDATLVVGAIQPFFLAYQQRDNRNLLSEHGQLCENLMGRWQAARLRTYAAPELPRAAIHIGSERSSKLRLGIVSAQIREHSVFNAITRGWLEHLNRQHIEISVFHLGTATDAKTTLARSLAEHFHSGARSVADWVRTIGEIDALVYPEVGMDQLTLQLASMRLAPLQMVAWGHPETSGLPTIDYYLSAAAFEPEGAERHYTERLFCMPNLGSCYQSSGIEVPGVSLQRFAIDRTVPVFLCLGAPFKYAADDDAVLIAIAERLGSCQFHFFEYRDGTLSRRLLERMARRFADAGVDSAAHLRLQPWASEAELHALMGIATAHLDTIGFSGFNTIMHAVESGLPMVTHRGRFLRGRFGSGILEQLGLTELVADDRSSYVETAVRLAEDPLFRSETAQRIVARRERLYGDKQTIAALQEILLSRPV